MNVATMPTILPDLDALKAFVGREVGVSGWLELPQEKITAFARLTGDRQWIHVDSARAAAESPYGTTVAHGFFTLALVSRLHAEAVQVEGNWSRIINYGLDRVRFPAPVPAGASIRGHSTLQLLEEHPDHVRLTWLITVEVQGQTKPALVAEWLVRLYRK